MFFNDHWFTGWLKGGPEVLGGLGTLETPTCAVLDGWSFRPEAGLAVERDDLSVGYVGGQGC